MVATSMFWKLLKEEHLSNSMNDIVKKIDIPSDNKLGKVVSRIVTILMIFLLIVYVMIRSSFSVGNSSANANGGKKYFTITTSDWFVLLVNKEVNFSIIPTNGITPSYTVMVNGNKTRMHVLPSNSGTVHLGYGITSYWFHLNQNQGLANALIEVE